MFCLIGGDPLKDGHDLEDNDAEPRDYIRDPVPRLPDHVGFLDEEEYKALADKHIAANNIDERKAKRYQSRAEALRAELSEYEAKAKQHTKSLERGRDVVNSLIQGIMYQQREAQREAAQLLSVKRKRVSHTLIFMKRKRADLAPIRPNWRRCGHIASEGCSFFHRLLHETVLSEVPRRQTKIHRTGSLMKW